MTIKHVSDDEIQDYLDGIHTVNKDQIDQHLSSCSICHNTFIAYQELYRGISTAEICDLAPDFADGIMRDIKKKLENKAQLKETIALIGLFLVGSTISFYFVNPFTGLMNMFKSLFNGTIQFIENILPTLNGYASMIIMVVLIFLVIEFLDKKVIKTKF